MPTRANAPLPDGFVYQPNLVRTDEHDALVDSVAGLDFAEIRMHGVTARRRAAHFGWLYGYESWALSPGPPMPDFLEPIRERAAHLLGVDPESLEETLVTEYRPGASIGWHRDAGAFGPAVVGISLGSPCRMRFRRKRDDGWETSAVELEPRSAYVLSGAARATWQHSIPPTRDLRYSITFRTLRRRRGVSGDDAADGGDRSPR